MAARTKKVTFNLREEVLAGLSEAIARGAAPSKNALVERALTRELHELRRRLRHLQWEEASRDPAFLNDIADVESAFQTADAESLAGGE